MIVAIVFVLITHGAIVGGLAIAGDWRVWRFITDLVAQLYALIGIAYVFWGSRHYWQRGAAR